jgi:alpha-L-rhamnosidase
VSAQAPRGLRCEWQTDPIGLGTRFPRFFWQLAPGPGARQSAYELLVARDEATLARDEGDLWASGRIASDAIAHVEYRGRELRSRDRAVWKVRIHDGEGTVSPWSSVARFELGLLERSDWQGRFIASPLAGGPRTSAPVPALRREFDLDREIVRARLYVAALGLYEIWLNGRRVGDQELAPGWTDFGKRTRYQAFDVTSLLARGANAIGALLGDGWYCGFLGLRGARERYGLRPALLAQLEVAHVDGTRTVVVTGSHWQWQASPILEADLLMGETVDARRDLGDWTRPSLSGASGKGWQPVLVASDPGISLDASAGPPIRVVRELHPVGPPVSRGNALFGQRLVYDFGQNMVGRVRLRVRGRRGDTVQLRHAEVLDAQGDLYVANLKGARATDTFTLAGTGEPEAFEPRFTFHGFRYVEVSGRIEPGAVVELTGVVLCSDMRETGSFACSDPDLDRLQSNIVWGQRGNFLDVPTDCPQRDERQGWTGDAQVFVRTASFNMEVAPFFAKWLRDLEDAQGDDGRVPPVAPVPMDGFIARADAGPAWGDAIVICPWTIWRCWGDRRLVEERWHGMVRYLEFLRRRFPDGIRSDPERDAWGGFGDWCALDGSDRRDSRIGGTPKDLIGTAFLAYSARRLAEMGAAIGRSEEARRWSEYADFVRAAFRRRFVTPHGLVAGNTQTSFLLALHFDLLEPNERDVTGRALARHVEAHGHLTTGFVGTPYLLPVLTAIGRLDLAYRLLLRREFPSWLYPVVHGGATTIWERWDGWTREQGFFDPEMNSFNHYAYGAVGEWLYGTVAGLDLDPSPNASGWRRARIAPRPPVHPGLPDPPLLTNARAELETLHGPYRVAWQLEDDLFQLQVHVPPGCSASLELPSGARAELSAGEHEIERPKASLLAG